jgi:hypothetical protein
MNIKNIRILQVKYADGYNGARIGLWENGKRVAYAGGGGYDMTGKVFGNWLALNYQNNLRTSAQVKMQYGVSENGKSVILDGACGIDSMIKIANCLNLLVFVKDTTKDSKIIVVIEN